MGVKLAKAMGCSVTVLSRSTSKKAEADKLGAAILAHSDEEALKEAAYSFDVIIDTISVHHEFATILPTLKVGGTYVCLGAVAQPVAISPMGLIFNHHSIEGSIVGGIPETQKMLDFCSEHNVLPEIKVIHAKDATDQFKALADGSAGAVRAVIDISTLADLPDRD
jgi:alcohol dehydrogenase (NADP+)